MWSRLVLFQLVLLLQDEAMAQPRDYWRTDLGSIPLSVAEKFPNKAPRYQMNQVVLNSLAHYSLANFQSHWMINIHDVCLQSTIIMPCNNSGYTDPKTTVGWAIIDFDWSNGKAIWTKQRPMMDEVVLQVTVAVYVCKPQGRMM